MTSMKIEEQISETLKHAPHKRGGLKYRVIVRVIVCHLVYFVVFYLIAIVTIVVICSGYQFYFF